MERSGKAKKWTSPLSIFHEEYESEDRFMLTHSYSMLFLYYPTLTHSLRNNYSMVYPITLISRSFDGE